MAKIYKQIIIVNKKTKKNTHTHTQTRFEVFMAICRFWIMQKPWVFISGSQSRQNNYIYNLKRWKL
jgi:hypothetical protein